MTPSEELEIEYKESFKEFKRQVREQRKLAKKHAKELIKKRKKELAEIYKAVDKLRDDKDEAVIEQKKYFDAQVKIAHAVIEFKTREQKKFENVSIIDLLHTPK